MFKTESYTLTSDVKTKALDHLGVPKNFVCDLFVNDYNPQEKLYCTRFNSAFHYNWTRLCRNTDVFLGQPPLLSIGEGRDQIDHGTLQNGFGDSKLARHRLKKTSI